MTTVQITLPDTRIERLKAVRASLAAEPLPAMTVDEVKGEIDAYRAAQRRAVGC
ncbi:MAG: hypothetical protein ACKVOJ_03065 [Sphingomonadaceae bacterium]